MSENHTPSSRYWSLSEELYRFTHQWPFVLLAILLGGLLGWLSQFLWPSYYRATAEIYVALNPYRAYSDTTFLALARPKYSNIDDFKNWQMSQLETVIFTDLFIDETLQNLNQQSSLWETMNADGLRTMLKAEWRSAGTWSLIANHIDPQRTAQAVQAWSEVAVTRVRLAVLAAQNTFQIDQQLDAITQQRAQAGVRRAMLQGTSTRLLAWQTSATNLPQNQPLEAAELWRVLAFITPVADYTPDWMALLNEQPDPSALPTDYIAWIDHAVAQINTESSLLDILIHELEGQQTELAIQYTAAFKDSLGLSPNLEIQNIQLITPRLIRPVGTLILLGGLIGLLAWIFIQLALPIRAAKQPREIDR